MSQTAPTPAPPSTEKTILRAEGLRRTFFMGEAEIQVLKNVDLAIRQGEFLAIEGRSGSGKSTLLHILGALDSVDAGTIEFQGKDYTRRTPPPQNWLVRIATGRGITRFRRLMFVLALAFALARMFVERQWVWTTALAFAAAWAIPFLLYLAAMCVLLWRMFRAWLEEGAAAHLRNKEFGFVFQFYHLLPELNVLENTLLAPMIERSWFGFRARRGEYRQRAEAILAELGMSHRLHHRPAQLSGGERQRVAIARALMNNPKVLFADEPTGNLDFETGSQIMRVLETLHRRGQTIVMVTHDRSVARQADRVLVLREGRLDRPDER